MNNSLFCRVISFSWKFLYRRGRKWDSRSVRVRVEGEASGSIVFRNFSLKSCMPKFYGTSSSAFLRRSAQLVEHLELTWILFEILNSDQLSTRFKIFYLSGIRIGNSRCTFVRTTLRTMPFFGFPSFVEIRPNSSLLVTGNRREIKRVLLFAKLPDGRKNGPHHRFQR